MNKQHVTIIDIAKALGISKSTVSRALSNHPNVHKQTKKDVIKLAKKLDYQKNIFSVNLKRRTSQTIGIIVPEFHRPYFPQIIVGAQEVAKEHGYNLIIAISDEKYEVEVANAEVMLRNQVDGLLVSLTKETKNYNHLSQFLRRQIPVVLFNRVCDELIVPKVIVDDYEGAFNAVEHLVLSGRKRIAHLSGPESLKICKKRKEGYQNCLKKHGLPIEEELIIHYDLNVDKANIYINDLLGLDKRPDAIFCINDPTAAEAIKAIKKFGLAIPQDIAVVGFSNDYLSTLIEPELTTVNQPVKTIGSTAAKLLIEQMNRDFKDWKAPTTTLKTELIIRDSS